jgi:phosphate transporter
MVDHERRRETIGFVNEDLPLNNSIYIKSALGIGLAFVVLVVCCNAGIFPKQEMNSCLGILLFASILWALESVPLFVTGLIIPLLVVLLRVMVVNGIRLSAKDTAKKVFGEMFGPVIILLLGGFSLAAGLSKHNIAKQMANVILARAGSNPRNVILANMFVSSFMSMWISNVAAPVLCFSLVNPILRNLPRQSGYGKSLVMGIAMAANVGGMASPIASPQNVISMGIMSPPPSWLEWFLIAIPVCVILDLGIWGVLLMVYKPGVVGVTPPEMSVERESLTMKQYWIIAVSVGTIILWCAESFIESVVGDMGVIALIPIIAFYGVGILTKDDWNSMLWSGMVLFLILVVMLAMGGIALGKAVDSSGLLNELAGGLVENLQDLTPFTCMALLSGVVVVVTSFISHTVGALIILPIVAQIGTLLPDPRPRALVMACALMCSGGMALPVSSFPNMNAISLEDSRGEPWLGVNDFIKIGTISSIMAWFLVVGVGWTMMSALEFY